MRSSHIRPIARRTACAVILITVFGWLLTAYHSPLNPLLIKLVTAPVAQSGNGEQLSIRRAGLSGGPHRLRISNMQFSAPWLGQLDVADIIVGYRLRPLLAGRIACHTMLISDVVFTGEVDPESEVVLPPLPAVLDLTTLPDISISPIVVNMKILDPNAQEPMRLNLTNGTIRTQMIRKPVKALPYTFEYICSIIINEGPPAGLTISGVLDPFAMNPETLNLDLDLALKSVSLPSLTATGSRSIPFIAENGNLSIYMEMCARHGRLSGLASLRIVEMAIRQNPGADNARFITLSFSAWNFLARQRNGSVEADAEIRGTVSQPEIPIGQILQAQAGNIGRSLTTRVLDAMPFESTREQSGRIDARREAAARHDDILKISRLPMHERHFERGRHYERVVRGYPTAVSEYLLQVEKYPEETNLAVQALMHCAQIRSRHLDQHNEAMQDLRKILNDYPDHPQAPDALLEKIRIAETLRQYPQAAQLCNEFTERYPTSSHSRTVTTIQNRIRRFVW